MRGRGPPRRRGVVEIMPRNRASESIYGRVVAIYRSSRYGGLVSVEVLLHLSRHQRRLLSESLREESYGQAYGSVRLCIVRWHPLGKARSHRVELMGSQSAMRIRLSTRKNGLSRLWEAMGTLSLRFDSESTDTVGRLVCALALALAASCQRGTHEGHDLYSVHDCEFSGPNVPSALLPPCGGQGRGIGLPFTNCARVNYHLSSHRDHKRNEVC